MDLERLGWNTSIVGRTNTLDAELPAGPSPPSKEEIVWAGKIIAKRQPWAPDKEAELVRAFRVAHEWRTLHAAPMQRVRASLRVKATHLDSARSLTAGRLKRMQSIRKKLQRSSLTLYQMQDIAGCRAITGSMASARALADHFRKHGGYRVRRETDYIAEPKPDGYRSHHLMLDFDAECTPVSPLRVELQVRTRLQHAWATAVEAVGAVSGVELKAGQGDALWLRFFVLMSAAIAVEEGAASVPGAPEKIEDVRAELVEVERRLDAVRKLESYSHAIRETEQAQRASGTSFLIQYDNLRREVSVRRWSKFSGAAYAYQEAELMGGQTLNSVLVDVDRLEDLRSAYPNYFLDVALFVKTLKHHLIEAGAGPETKAEKGDPPPASAVAEVPNFKRKIDLAWWFGIDEGHRRR